MRKNHRMALSIIVLVLIPLLLPLIVKNPYYIHLMIMTGINAVLAMSFILMLRTGLISLCVASFWGIGAYATTVFSMKLSTSFWLALPAGVIVTGLIALVFGIVLVKNAGFSFVILTMVFSELVVLVIGQARFLGGWQGLVGIPPVDGFSLPIIGAITFTSKIAYYYLMLVLFWLVALVFSALYSAWIGRAWLAIGLKPNLAESIGVDLYKYRIVVFMVAAMAAGLMGGFYAHYYGTIEPETFITFKTIYVHIMAVLGGVGSVILGPIVGALILTLVPEFLRLTSEVEPILTGFIILLVILFLPKGLMGITEWRMRRFGKKKADPDRAGSHVELYASAIKNKRAE